MKKKIVTLLVIYLLLVINVTSTFGQAVFRGPGPTLIIRAGSTVSTTFIGPDPNIFAGLRMQSSTININWIGTWPGNAMAAFSHARDIWEHSITSAATIWIDAHWTDLGSVS